MKQLALGIVAAGLAAAALTPLAAASTPSCATKDLKVTFNVIPNSQGAGNEEYTLKVKNTGFNACSLGKPTITLLGKRGKRLPSNSISTGKAVVVGAGATAKARARFSPDVPGTGDRQSGTCEPTAYRVKLAFSGSVGTVTGAIKPPTPVCERGTMTLTRLKV